MLCYNRYILKHLLGPALFITLSLTGIVWLAQSLRFIDLIVNRGLSVSLFLYLTALLMPSLLSVVLPVSAFCAVCYTYQKLTADSELIVLESIGLSKQQLAKPAIIMASVLCGAGFMLSLLLMPASFREFKDLQYFIRNNYASVLLQEGVFNSPTPDLTVYVRKREQNGILRGILVYDNSKPEHPTTMMAREGFMLNSDAGPQIILEKGNRQEVNSKTNELSLLYFDKYTVNLNMYVKPEEDRQREPQEQYLGELLASADAAEQPVKGKLRAEAHQRLTWPLYNLVLPLLALGALLSGDFNRRGQWKKLVTATALTFLAVAMALGISNLAAKYMIFVVMMYSIPLIFALGAWLRLIPDSTPRKNPRS